MLREQLGLLAKRLLPLRAKTLMTRRLRCRAPTSRCAWPAVALRAVLGVCSYRRLCYLLQRAARAGACCAVWSTGQQVGTGVRQEEEAEKLMAPESAAEEEERLRQQRKQDTERALQVRTRLCWRQWTASQGWGAHLAVTVVALTPAVNEHRQSSLGIAACVTVCCGVKSRAPRSARHKQCLSCTAARYSQPV